jgi:hypothetical protein
MKSAWLAALLLAVLPASVLAEKPQAVLFDAKHLDLVGKDDEVTYRFERKPSSETLLGKAFTDDIKLAVTKVNDKGERDVVLKIFTGEQARDPSSITELTINPLMIWYFERSVKTFAQLAGGNYNYLKKKLLDTLQDAADAEPIKIDYNGKSIDAFRIAVRPYAEDASSSKMQGYEGTKFTMVVSKDAPGYIVDLLTEFDTKSATAPSLKEHITLVGIGESK